MAIEKSKLEGNVNSNYLKKGILICLYFLVFISSIFLFYGFITKLADSDFPAHISTVLKKAPMYSLMHYLIGMCYLLSSHELAELALSILMSIIFVGTSFGMFLYLVRRVGDKVDKYTIVFFALMLLFVSNLYIPAIFPHLYTNYTSVSQPLHNSTYLLMRFFSVLVTIFYFKIYEQVKLNEFHIKDGIIFCIFLTLCNFSKPNFLLAFAPMSLIVFLILFIRKKGKNFKILFQWGVFYILSLPCLLYMTRIVYDESTNSSIVFETNRLWDYLFGNSGIELAHGQFIICELSNLLFPLFVLIVFSIKKLKKEDIETDRVLQGFLLFFIAHLQQLLMVEDGPRRYHGNYDWGLYCAGMILFLICIGEWLRAYSTKQIKNKNVFICGLVIFLLQVLSGIFYYIILLSGRYYFY